MTTVVSNNRYIIADKKVTFTENRMMACGKSQKLITSDEEYVKLRVPDKKGVWKFLGDPILALGFAGNASSINPILKMLDNKIDLGHWVRGMARTNSVAESKELTLHILTKKKGLTRVNIDPEGDVSWGSFTGKGFLVAGSGYTHAVSLTHLIKEVDLFSAFLYAAYNDPDSCVAYNFFDREHPEKGIQLGLPLTERQIRLKLEKLQSQIKFYKG